MSRTFEKGNKERLSVTGCINQVYGKWSSSFSIDETSPQFCVKVTMDNEEVLEWDSTYFVDWTDMKKNSFKKLLNKEMTRGYAVNLRTGEARWKYVLPEKQEQCFTARKEGKEHLLSIQKMVGVTDKASFWNGWDDGERANVVKVEIFDRDEMPVQNVLVALARSLPSHPAYLREKLELPYIGDNSKSYFIKDLKQAFNTIREDDADEELSIKLCRIVDLIFQTYNKTRIEFEWVWMDYFHSVKSGSVLRTKDIIEFFKERDVDKMLKLNK